MTYGSENTFFNQTWYGDQAETALGRVGWLFEGHVQATDGFRELDGGGADSGFELYEPMLKLSFEPNGNLRQRLFQHILYKQQVIFCPPACFCFTAQAHRSNNHTTKLYRNNQLVALRIHAC